MKLWVLSIIILILFSSIALATNSTNTTCGDGTCAVGESPVTCKVDCPMTYGDQLSCVLVDTKSAVCNDPTIKQDSLNTLFFGVGIIAVVYLLYKRAIA